MTAPDPMDVVAAALPAVPGLAGKRHAIASDVLARLSKAGFGVDLATAPDPQSAALHAQFDAAIRQRDAAAVEAAELREVNAGLCCRVAELEGELAAVRAERDVAKAATIMCENAINAGTIDPDAIPDWARR